MIKAHISDRENDGFLPARREEILAALMEQNEADVAKLAELSAKLAVAEQNKREAAAQGDRSENAEYQNAVEEVTNLTKSISELEVKRASYTEFMGTLNAFSLDISGHRITVGSTVLISCYDSGATIPKDTAVWFIVPSELSDATKGLLSVESPVGAALLAASKDIESITASGSFNAKKFEYPFTTGDGSRKNYTLWRFI